MFKARTVSTDGCIHIAKEDDVMRERERESSVYCLNEKQSLQNHKSKL